MSFAVIRVGNMVASSVWETEKIGIAITCSCIVMVLFNRIHKYLPFLKCWTKDATVGVVEPRTVHCIPDSIDKILARTKFTKEELKTIYRRFKNDFPHGVFNKDAFTEIYRSFFPGVDTELYAHLVFNTFVHYEEGYVNFEEFVSTLSLLSRGSLREKLQWIFKLYDINNVGYITIEEIHKVIMAIHLLLRPTVEPAIAEARYAEHSSRAFHKFDPDGNGKIYFDKFYHACINDHSIVRSLGVFENTL